MYLLNGIEGVKQSKTSELDLARFTCDVISRCVSCPEITAVNDIDVLIKEIKQGAETNNVIASLIAIYESYGMAKKDLCINMGEIYAIIGYVPDSIKAIIGSIEISLNIATIYHFAHDEELSRYWALRSWAHFFEYENKYLRYVHSKNMVLRKNEAMKLSKMLWFFDMKAVLIEGSYVYMCPDDINSGLLFEPYRSICLCDNEDHSLYNVFWLLDNNCHIDEPEIFDFNSKLEEWDYFEWLS